MEFPIPDGDGFPIPDVFFNVFFNGDGFPIPDGASYWKTIPDWKKPINIG